MAPVDPRQPETSNMVLVIGSGLAGLSLSLGLANAGFRVELVEKNFDFSRTGATFGLQPNGQKALRELCGGDNAIVEQLQAIGVIMSHGGIMMGWWDMRDSLLKLVRAKSDRIRLHMGWMLQGIVDGDHSVLASFKKRTLQGSTSGVLEDEIMTLEGCMLVGADGVNSVVRDFLGLPKATKTEITCWRGRLQLDIDGEKKDENGPVTTASDVLRPLLDNPVMATGFRMHGSMQYTLFNFHPKLPGTMALVVGIQKGEGFPINTSPQTIMEEAVKDDEKELAEVRAIGELVDQDGMHHPVRMKVVELPQEHSKGWGGKGRLTLTGDAAHAMRPASGQGGSMAFEDNVVLCRSLKNFTTQGNPSFKDKLIVQEALMEYENSRLPRVRKLWADQWERSEKVYKNVLMEPWTPEFEDWVYQGV